VTGGAGFIGSHLVDRLVADGDRVIAIDNLVNGRRSNLDQAIDLGQVELHEVDIVDGNRVEELIHGADRLFHLAGLADIVPSIENPVEYHRVNADGTVAVMEAVRNAGVGRVVYAASSSCYGIPDEYPTSETSEVRPQYPYALSKYLGEQIALHWGQVYGIGVNALRLFNVYGLRHRTSGAYGAVLGVFLAQRLAEMPLTIVGDGTQTRDFTYVTDVADAFVAASESPMTGNVFNVGSGGTYTVNHLAELIGGPSVNVPRRPGEPDCTFADISKIRQELNWRPRVNFEEGVGRVMERIQDWADAPVWTPEKIADATRVWFDTLGDHSEK
jgi:UDP-glucose 4-epimerase